MIGDKRKYNVALITLLTQGANGEKPGNDILEGVAATLVAGVKTVQQAVQNPDFIKKIEHFVKLANEDGTVCPSHAARIAKFTILPSDYSVETGELTPTLKLKRSVAEAKYLKGIEAMYQDTSSATFIPYPA